MNQREEKKKEETLKETETNEGKNEWVILQNISRKMISTVNVFGQSKMNKTFQFWCIILLIIATLCCTLELK